MLYWKVIGLGGLLFLGRCSDTLKKTFGTTHYQPDEFKIIQHSPLEIPPSYQLPCPQKPGFFDQKQAVSIQEKAQKALQFSKQQKGSHEDEKAFLTQASKGETVSDSIRDTLEKEEAKSNNPLKDKIESLKEEIGRNFKNI